MKPHDTKKGKWQTNKIKLYRDMIKSITQHSYFEKNLPK
jgi:hypothetical protein